MPGSERGVARKPGFGKAGVGTASTGKAQGQGNQRLHHRVMAWRKMPVVLVPEAGRNENTLIVNISHGGLAVDWKAAPVPVGVHVQFDIPGYPTGDGTVVACSRGVLRMRCTGSVAIGERDRLRSDCEKGLWSGRMLARWLSAPAAGAGVGPHTPPAR